MYKKTHNDLSFYDSNAVICRNQVNDNTVIYHDNISASLVHSLKCQWHTAMITQLLAFFIRLYKFLSSHVCLLQYYFRQWINYPCVINEHGQVPPKR